MIALIGPVGWMLIGVGGAIALACVAVVIAAVVASVRNPIKKSFDVDPDVFNSHPEEKQDK